MLPIPRHLRSPTSKTLLDQLLCRQIALAIEYARVLILDRCTSFFQLLDRHQRSFEDIERLEAGDDDGDVVARADGIVLAVSHHSADVARTEEALHAIAGGTEDGFERWRHQDMRDQQRKIVHLLFTGSPSEHRVGRSRGFEADSEEDDLLVADWRGRSSGNRAASRRCEHLRRAT